MELQKSGLEKFAQLTERKADSLPSPINSDLYKSYETLCSVILSSAKVYVPRSRRKIYTTCWDQQNQVLLELLQDAPKASQQIIAEKLIHHLDKFRRNRCEEAVNNTDFTHSSRKVWFVFNRLTERAIAHHAVPISVHTIASRLINCGKFPNPDKVYLFQVRKAIIDINQSAIADAELCNPIILLRNARLPYSSFTKEKSSGHDNINLEFFKNLGPIMLNWISSFFF